MVLEPDFIEAFIGPKDMVQGIERAVDIFGGCPLPIVVHVPEYLDDMFIDLTSNDEKVRERSFQAVSMSVTLADALGAKHIVIHPGGVTLEDVDKVQSLKRLKGTLAELSYDGFYLENMPWFYFQAGKKKVRFSIMVDVSDFEAVLDVIGGMTVDTCHGFLSIEGGSMDRLLSFFDRYPKLDRYYHISDASPPDGEGLQIGEGELDFKPIIRRTDESGWMKMVGFELSLGCSQEALSCL